MVVAQQLREWEEVISGKCFVNFLEAQSTRLGCNRHIDNLAFLKIRNETLDHAYVLSKRARIAVFHMLL